MTDDATFEEAWKTAIDIRHGNRLPPMPIGSRDFARVIWDARGELADEERKEAIRDFVRRVNTRAEVDMLSGNPVTGAHHRAIGVEIAALEER